MTAADWLAAPRVATADIRRVARLDDSPVRVEVEVRGAGWVWIGPPGLPTRPWRCQFVRDRHLPLLVPPGETRVVRAWNLFGFGAREYRVFVELSGEVRVPEPQIPAPPATVVLHAAVPVPDHATRLAASVEVPVPNESFPPIAVHLQVHVPGFHEVKR